jgi:hypothetical protein
MSRFNVGDIIYIKNIDVGEVILRITKVEETINFYHCLVLKCSKPDRDRGIAVGINGLWRIGLDDSKLLGKKEAIIGVL